MKKPREALSDFTKQHPRLASILYQALLWIVTLWCAIAIARYGPGPKTDDPTGNPSNRTVERICKYGAREEVDLGPFLSEFVVPHFILCPSALTLIAACVLYIVGIFRLCYHNRDDIDQPYFIFQAFLFFFINMDWKDVLGSLQTTLAIILLMMVTLSAIMHLTYRWVAPDYYAVRLRRARVQRQEYQNKWLQRLQRDVEGAAIEVTSFEVGVNDETPLTGRGFARMRDGAYVEIPEYSAQAVRETGPETAVVDAGARSG